MRNIILTMIITCTVWPTTAMAQTRWTVTTKVDPMTDATFPFFP